MPRITGTLTQLATGLPIVNGADVANVSPEFSTLALLRAAPLETRHVYANSKRWLWNGASTATDDGTEDATSVQKTGTATGRYLPSPVQGSTLSIHLPGSTVAVSGITGEEGSVVGGVWTPPEGTTINALTPDGTVTVSNVDTLQAGAGGRIAVDSLGQRFPRKTEFSKFCDGEPASIGEAAARSIAAGTVFLLRQQDRYIDTGTGQVRSRAWNDPDKYLVLGETGDACPQIWWTGNRGVKTGAGATSCVRIPNAYIDPDAAFSVTILLASLPGNTVAHRPLLMIGSQHGTTAQARALVKQHDTLETHCIYNASDATYGYSLAGICPYAVTVAAATGAGGSTSFYRNGALHVSKAKVAGTIYTDDHVIGGFWDQAGGVWVSYKGFYVMGVIIHTTQISAEVVELHRALVGMDKVPAAISIGQSNNGLVGGDVPDAPALPSYAAASNETSVNGLGIGWGPVEPQKYGDEATGSQYSVTQGIAPSLPGYALFKITLGGHQMTSFYDWTAADFEVIYEPLMRAAWQLGCSVDLRHIFVVSGESEADISLPANDVRNRLIEMSARYRRGFQQNLTLQPAIRVTLNQLNNQYALVRPVGTPLVRSGQALFAAADANARMVDVDAIPLGGDNTHYSANDRIRVGMLLGAAAIGA